MPPLLLRSWNRGRLRHERLRVLWRIQAKLKTLDEERKTQDLNSQVIGTSLKHLEDLSAAKRVGVMEFLNGTAFRVEHEKAKNLRMVNLCQEGP
ncbi:hypothetical protein ACLB2K_011965 [Fragaria x ananassa]